MPNRSAILSAAAATLIALTGASSAQMKVPPPTNDPAKVPSGTYALNTQHSQVIFRILHLGISPYYGRITKPSGTLTLDAAHLEKSTLTVEIPTATVSVTVSQLDSEIAGPRGFNTAQFPKATFQSTAIRRTGAKTADITGNLNFRGVTKPVTLHATFVGALQMPWADNAWGIGFSVMGTIKRSDFGMTDGMWATTSNDVDLLIEGEFGQKQ